MAAGHSRAPLLMRGRDWGVSSPGEEEVLAGVGAAGAGGLGVELACVGVRAGVRGAGSGGVSLP